MVHFQPKPTRTGDPLENLELLSAACVLAPSIYRQRGEAFGTCKEWRLLSAGDRQFYIDVAIEVLREVEPERGQVVSFNRGEAS